MEVYKTLRHSGSGIWFILFYFFLSGMFYHLFVIKVEHILKNKNKVTMQ